MPTRKLTRTERGILMHRLEVPDAIADCFDDADQDALQGAIAAVRLCVRIGVLPDPRDLTCLEREVLHDLVEGSTWLAAAESEIGDGITRAQFGRMRRAFDRLYDDITNTYCGEPE